VPTFGAPSCKTVSAFQVLKCCLMVARHLSVVMSLWKVMVLGMGLMGVRSTPTIMLLAGIVSAATWHQDPGAAQRSKRTLLFSRKPYFRLSCMSLKAALALYPFSLASLYHLSNRPFADCKRSDQHCLPVSYCTKLTFFWIPMIVGVWWRKHTAGKKPIRSLWVVNPTPRNVKASGTGRVEPRAKSPCPRAEHDPHSIHQVQSSQHLLLKGIYGEDLDQTTRTSRKIQQVGRACTSCHLESAQSQTPPRQKQIRMHNHNHNQPLKLKEESRKFQKGLSRILSRLHQRRELTSPSLPKTRKMGQVL